MSQPPQTAKDIFLAALDADLTARVVLLDDLCAGDVALRRQVEDLLQVHDEPDSFLDNPRINLGLTAEAGTLNDNPTINQPIIEVPGTVIGHYKLLEEIGEGGMGVVYLAEQREPVERQVALKIIRPGMDSRNVVARFQAERHALAMMDHPNIARVLDAGTADAGQPYFAMELIKGVPITQYCDEHNLSTRRRLELFVVLCQAVQHAHQKGIIHRDLKPSNILVTLQDGQSVPKIIDFGIAKATGKQLADETTFTLAGQIVGTPLYMSPEQAELNAADVDTRSDIYSLGVLLYELLTGCAPFDRERLLEAGLDEVRRVIREEEPPRPSRRLSTLGADAISTITAHRGVDPRRLSRLLRGELDWIVMKSLEKDRARRYQTANGFANDIERYLNGEAVLACPPSAAYRFKTFARRNKTVLSTIAFVAAALVLGMLGTSWQAIRATGAKQLAGERLVAEQRAREETDRARRAEVKQRSLAEQERDRAEKNLELATAEQQRAEGNLDLALAALDSLYLKAIGWDRLLGEPVASPGAPEPPESGLRPLLTDLERELLQRGLDFYDQFAQKNAAAPRSLVQTAQAYYRVGLLQGTLGNPAAAAAAYRSAVERFERLTKEDPDNAEHFRGLGDVHLYLGYRQPDWELAKKAHRSSFLAYSRAIELRPNDPALYLSRAQSRGVSAEPGVVEDYERAIQLDPHNLDALLRCAGYYNRDLQKGCEYAEQAIATAPEDPRGHIALANVLGEVEIGGLHPRKNAAVALEHYARAIELAPLSPGSYSARGAFYFFNQDHQLALTDLNRALELNSADRYALRTRARVFVELGEYDKALADLAVLSESFPNWVSVPRVTGDAHLGKENWQAAIDAYTRVVEIDPASWSILKRRAFAYANLGHYPQALADLKRALELNPNEISTLSWLPPRLVDACPDPSFRESLLELAAKAADKSPDRPRALQDRASFYLGLREWKRAKADLETAIKSETADHDAHYRHALLCLMLNEAQAYRDACAAMVRKFGESDDPMEVNFVAWTCALAPEAVEDYEPVVAYATKTVEARPGCDQFLNTLGAILYRAGRHQAAIEWLTELDRPQEHPAARADSSPAYTGYLLAMAHKMIGKEEQAREYLQKANQCADEELANEQPPTPWNRRITLELLRKEAEALLAAAATGRDQSDQQAWHPVGDAALSLNGPRRWVMDCRRAGRFAAEGNWTEAAGALSQAIQLRPDDGALWRALGEAHEQLDQWDTALADYQKAMELSPQEWRHCQTRAEHLAQSQRCDQAIALYTSLITHHSDNAALWKARGEVCEQADQWHAAIADYRKAMDLEPRQRPVWKARAKQYAQSEQWDKAITLYTSLLQYGADDPELWQSRAVAHAGLKQWDQAIADYGQVIELKPDDVKAWRQRARAYGQLKAYDKAIADYSAIIQLKPDDPKAWGERAQAYFHLADYDKAIADHSQAILLDPKNSWHYIGRAQAQSLKLENFDRALADCHEAIRLDPQNRWGYAGRALVHLSMRNYDGAIADSSEALRPTPSTHVPPCPWAYVHRAEAYLAKGDYERAVADCQQAIQVLPEYPRSYMLRAEGFLTLRRYDDAVADSNRYAELEPADPTAALMRAQTLLMADRTEEYRQACGQILDRFEHSEDPATVCHAVRACALSPEAIPDPMVPVKLAERAVARKPAEWALYTLGIAQFRAGQLEAAARRFHESLKTAPSWEARFLNWLGLALVCQGLGETAQAREWLGKAIPLIEQRSARCTQDRVEGQLLRCEVEQLLGTSEQEQQGAQVGKEK